VDYIVKSNRRHRYISFRIVSKEENHSFTDMELIQIIRQQTYDLFSRTSKELGLWLVQFDGITGIIKCHYKEKEHTIQLLQSLKKIGLESVTVTTYATSGTIRGITDKKRIRSRFE
jgi:RNase P/RNase MRP subunit POP5